MNIRRSQTRKALSAGISLLMLTLSIAVPLIERADVSHETAVESEHNPLQCPPAHDHTVCTQASANLAVAASTQSTHVAWTVTVEMAQPAPSGAVTMAFPEGHPSRAPPLA